MRGPVPIYGLDIETDTTVDGLDPAVSPVVTVALSAPAGDEVFAGAEADLLAALDARVRALEPGVIATWNGAAFDLPFLADRALACGLALGLRLAPDPTVVLAHGPLPGHGGAYRATWYGHGHLDAYRVYRSDVGRVLRVSCSLKAIARMVGLTPVEVDRERIHELPAAVLDAYVASDARLARILAERRWPGASHSVDTCPPGSGLDPALDPAPVDPATDPAPADSALDRAPHEPASDPAPPGPVLGSADGPAIGVVDAPVTVTPPG